MLQSAWDFVCSLAPTNEFEYAYTNSATEDYCDTIWHTTQNVKLHESLNLIDARDMYNTAVDNYYNFVDTNLADLTVEAVYESLDSISGDTAMRDSYYAQLRSHFKQFVADNKHLHLRKLNMLTAINLLVSTVTQTKRQLVSST